MPADFIPPGNQCQIRFLCAQKKRTVMSEFLHWLIVVVERRFIWDVDRYQSLIVYWGTRNIFIATPNTALPQFHDIGCILNRHSFTRNYKKHLVFELAGNLVRHMWHWQLIRVVKFHWWVGGFQIENSWNFQKQPGAVRMTQNAKVDNQEEVTEAPTFRLIFATSANKYRNQNWAPI